MTRYQYQAALQCIKNFLVCRSYDIRHTQEEVEDGQWIGQCIDASFESSCDKCYPVFTTELLMRLENGSFINGEPLLDQSQNPWQPCFSAEVRKIAGLPDPP